MRPIVEVKSLVKHYGTIKAVDEISFTINQGDIFAFLGPNGAGKTTTVEILECQRTLTSGTAKIFGYDVTREDEVKEIKKCIGVLPQEYNALDKLSVKENIDLIGDMYTKKLSTTNTIDLLGLKEKTNQRFQNLSGGLKQRVGIACALINDPQLLFLDEPTTGLDPKARRDVWEVIRNLKNAGKTVFLTTHYMEEAEVLANKVAIIDKGKISAIGSPEELISKFGGSRVLTIKKGDKKLAAALQKEFAQTTFDNNGHVNVSVVDVAELWHLMGVLTEMKIDKDIEIKSASMDDVFLNVTGGRITEEGELKQ